MGLTIHYSGKFKADASLCNMIEEVKDIAEANEWRHHIFETEFPKKSPKKNSAEEKIYGIVFTPEGSETVHLTFLENRRMFGVYNLEFGKRLTEKEREKQYMFSLFTKTQYAGAETHKQIVHVLKYISRKYFSAFEVFDEGNYWDTEDPDILQQSFNRYNEILSHVSNVLENLPQKKGETVDEFITRMTNELKRKKK